MPARITTPRPIFRIMTGNFAVDSFTADSFAASSFGVDSFAARQFYRRQFHRATVSTPTVSPLVVSTHDSFKKLPRQETPPQGYKRPETGPPG